MPTSAQAQMSATPAAVPTNDDGVWEISQEVPYQTDTSAIGGTRLRVVIVVAGEDIVDDVFDIPTSVECTDILGQCSGPWRFELLRITVPD